MTPVRMAQIIQNMSFNIKMSWKPFQKKKRMKIHKWQKNKVNDFYEARRHIQSTMMGDTPVKTGQNRQCIDNVSDYDREHRRIF